MIKHIRWFPVYLALAFIPVSAIAQQQGGTITGRVVDRQTSAPLIGAQIVVVGTNLGAVTNQMATNTAISAS